MSPGVQAVISRYLATAGDEVIVDFESFYNKERVTVKKLGNRAYFRDPKSDIYLVTIFGKDIHYVGHPSEAPWHKINGRRWIAHNVGFDKAAYEYLQEIHGAPVDVKPSDWVDTADLCAYFGYPRNLAGACRFLFGIELNKSVRDVVMKDKYWWQFSDETKATILEYADDDAIAWCVYQELYPKWPEHERWLSTHTLLMADRGVPCDIPKLEAHISILQRMLFELERMLPWLGEEDEKGKPYALMSRKGMQQACDRADVPMPTTTSLKNQAFLDWLDEYGERVPSLGALSRYRRVKRQLDVYQAMKTRLRPDGRVDASLKYYGADATGRWAGGGGLNLQNFLKLPIFCTADYQWSDVAVADGHTIDVRSCIKAPPGKKLIVADLSQIEPRVLNWIVGNDPFLDLIREGMGPYEAHAKDSGYTWEGKLKKTKPSMYALFKARVLALGYSAGWRKFISMAAGYIPNKAEFDAIFATSVSVEDEARFISYLEWMVANMNHTDSKRDLRIYRTELDDYEKKVWVNSWLQVTDFRDKSPLLAGRDGIWKTLDRDFKASVNDGYFELELPSGRVLRYFDVSSARGWSARRVRGGMPGRVYGGLLTENITQAIARDVFSYGIRMLEEAGFKIFMHVHDEVLVECDLDVDPETIVRILTQVPSWAAKLPVGAEASESDFYQK